MKKEGKPNFLKIYFFFILFLVAVGFVLPYLISCKSDIPVLIGFGVIAAFFGFIFVKGSYFLWDKFKE